MLDSLQRVPRPGSPTDTPATANRGIQRNSLTLALSVAAIILSCATAAVNLFIFFGGGREKLINEADHIRLTAEANRVLSDLATNPQSHPELRVALGKLYKSILYRPPFDAKLNVYERAAFGLVVQSYALPLADVQLRSSEAMLAAYPKGSAILTQSELKEVRCSVDPYGPDCPADGEALRPAVVGTQGALATPVASPQQ